jgi:hypothetical protein
VRCIRNHAFDVARHGCTASSPRTALAEPVAVTASFTVATYVAHPPETTSP